MARPKPVVLLKSEVNENFKVEEILSSSGIYAVFYDESPINIKSYVDLASCDTTPKYKKTSFPSVGHARALAKRLNTQFNTDKFSVYRLKPDSDDDKI